MQGWGVDPISPDGTFNTTSPEAIEAATYYRDILANYSSPGVSGFNWNECQSAFALGQGAMWQDGIGFATPLEDETQSKVAGKVGFGVFPKGPVAQHSAMFGDGIGVSAPDDATLVIHLNFPASYFMSMTPMWTLAAVPQWAIEANGEKWIEAGNIVTDGRYVLNEWVHGVRRTVLRNPLMPEDMYGAGNIEKIVANVVPDVSTGYALWMNNEVETSGIPDAELQGHLEKYKDETIQVPDLAVFYFGFRETKAPFDDPRVRRAFSAAFDRETFVSEVRQGQGLPMKHFAPPGIFGAPPIDEVGVGYDPEFAKQQLADAGYPNCEGFPTVTLLGYSGQSTLNWIEFAQKQWQENLGCSPDVIQIEQQSFKELLAATAADVPDEEAPHMWTLGWGPDYPDENNWVGDVLWCENPGNRMKRECNEIDDMIVAARQETDPDKRVEMYKEIEEKFFGEEGEMPMAPLYVRIAYMAIHSWYSYQPALFGGDQWYNYSIDQAAQMAAMNK
jgi:ABC-type oligopeptide transport system substrate-binding subunit